MCEGLLRRSPLSTDARSLKLADDLKLVDCRLDSLGVAIVVMRLEDQLGFDSFERDHDLEFPKIFSDFVRLYESRGP